MDSYSKLTQTQKLALDIIKVERNHSIPDTDNHENVGEHTFSVQMLCWKLYDQLKPDLDLEKILKYALVHDFPERGQKNDINTYASQSERQTKEEKEALETEKIIKEFGDFEEMTNALQNYNKFADEEARFVWSVDKIQGIVLGDMDKWRPYASYGVTYKQFCDKGDEFVDKCSPCLKEIMQEVNRESRKTYYDRPRKD